MSLGFVVPFIPANISHRFLGIIVCPVWGLEFFKCTSYAHLVTLAVGYSWFIFSSLAYTIFLLTHLFALPFLIGGLVNRCSRGFILIVIFFIFCFLSGVEITLFSYSYTYFLVSVIVLFSNGISTMQCI
jgi:hypothetical protein